MARYKKDGLEYPSVTEIIGDCTDKSGALTQWAANMVVEWIKQNALQDDLGIYLVATEHLNDARFNFRKVSQKAKDVGSEVHDCIERYLSQLIVNPNYDPENIIDTIEDGQVANAFGAFIEWSDNVNLRPVLLEQKVYGNGWAGTLDFNGLYHGKKYIIDWKSSKGHYDEMKYQVAAYRSVSGNNIEGCGVLRLDKETGIPDFKDTSKSYENDLAIFESMVVLYMTRHPIIAKKSGWIKT